MKDFVKMTLAVVCGFAVVAIVCFTLLFGMIGAVAGSGSTPVIPKSGVLKIDMSKMVVAEQTQEANPLAALPISNGQSVQSIGILDAINALDAAAQDPAVKYIYLKVDGSMTSLAHSYEFRQALKAFREKSGKAIVSYTESPTTGSYYMASVSDKIYMTPHQGSMIAMNGVSSQMFFLKDILDKFGVNVQLIRHGKYKSAGEMYTRSEASAENREQYQVMINSMWQSIASEIAESRGISVDELNGMIDKLELCLPEDFLSKGMVDGLLTRGELESKLADLAVEQNFRKVSMISFADYVAAKTSLPVKAKNRIAIIYADGQILDGSATQEVAGDRFAAEIEKVRADSTIKAVVLRVNSPGGSVLASEKIKQELDLLGEVKPVVASYGDYAASGGYWISNNCEKIYSDPVTLTGSIGVFGMIPDFSKTLKNVAHVNITSINSNRHGDMYSMMRPFDQAEYNYMLKSIETVYDKFITIVGEGRGMAKEDVDAIGQGRVWTGSDALNIGLVDEIGTIKDALEYAATLAGDVDLANWKICGYPAVPSAIEALLASFNSTGDNDFSILARQFEDIKSPRILARLPYSISIQ